MAQEDPTANTAPQETPEDQAWREMQEAQAESTPAVSADIPTGEELAAAVAADEAETAEKIAELRSELGINPDVSGEASAVGEEVAPAEEARQDVAGEQQGGGGGGLAEAAGMTAVVAVGAGMAAEAFKEATEEPVDPVKVNNRIVHLPEHQQAEAIANLSEAELAAVAKMIKDDSEKSYDPNRTNPVQMVLSNFKYNAELVQRPEVQEAIKNVLRKEWHVYRFGNIINIPGFDNEMLQDPEVKKALIESAKRFFRAPRGDELYGLKAVDKFDLTDIELREVAEEIKGNSNSYSAFVQHYGVKRLYPELR